jgi:hypothetical protein
MGFLVRCSLEVKAKSNTAVIRFYLDYRALTKEKSHNCGLITAALRR